MVKQVYSTDNAEVHTYGVNPTEIPIDGLLKVARLNGTVSPVIGLSDLSPVSGGFPNGGTFVSEEYVAANAVGMDINCGFSLSELDIRSARFHKNGKLNERKIRRLFEDVEKRIPIHTSRVRPKLEGISMQEVLYHGVQALPSEYISPEDIAQIEYQGSLDGDFDLDERTLKLASQQFPTIGGGNHFIDFVYVDKIFDQEATRNLDIDPKKVYVLIHTGSKGVGFEVNKHYNELFKQHPEVQTDQALSFLQKDHDLAIKYLRALNAAANFAFASRAVLRNQLEIALDTESRLIRDSSHNLIDMNENTITHRKGTQIAFPEQDERLNERDYKFGTPFIVPGSMTSEIYLCLPGQNISETHFTVNHGSGRKVPREIADKRHHDPKFKQATGNIVLNLEKTKLAREEAPYNYRDVGATMKDLETTGLAAKVARLQPFGVMIMGKK